MTEKYTGKCTCGSVRYEVQDEPMFVHCCHCTWCQRSSGSAFALNAIIEATNVVLMSGDVEIVDTPTKSGRGQKFTRCTTCRDTLWSTYAVPKIGDRLRFVRVGTLDEPTRIEPSIHIFTSTKQPWVTLPDNVPVVPEYYSPADMWPEQSYARRVALEE